MPTTISSILRIFDEELEKTPLADFGIRNSGLFAEIRGGCGIHFRAHAWIPETAFANVPLETVIKGRLRHSTFVDSTNMSSDGSRVVFRYEVEWVDATVTPDKPVGYIDIFLSTSEFEE